MLIAGNISGVTIFTTREHKSYGYCYMKKCEIYLYGLRENSETVVHLFDLFYCMT